MAEKSKQYKAVFIDWDDTIGDFHSAEIKALTDIYNKYQLNRLYPDFQAYYDVYHPHNVALWDKYGKSELTKDELQFNRFYYPLALADKETENIKATAQLIGDDFCRLTTQYFSTIPNAVEVVKALADKYPITIVSNGFVEVQYTKIELSGLKPYISHVVLSEEVGVQKPNPLIYQKALQLNGVKAHEAIMIGDSFNSDIQGAINAGIDQLWITTEQPSQQHNATFMVPTIIDVLKIL